MINNIRILIVITAIVARRVLEHLPSAKSLWVSFYVRLSISVTMYFLLRNIHLFSCTLYVRNDTPMVYFTFLCLEYAVLDASWMMYCDFLF